MEWIDFAGWDSELYRQPYAVRGWVTPAPKPKRLAREDVAAQLADFVRACPDTQLFVKCAPPSGLR